MSDSATYDAWARIYDSVYSYVRDDVPFYVREAMESQGPVLELGCGTGRVTVPIARAGVNVVGIDFSEAMLARARAKAAGLPKDAGDVSLLHADMRDFSLEQRFDLVIIPFRGLLALPTAEDQAKTLRNVRRHLSTGGRLIFSVFVPDLNMLVQDADAAYHLRDVTDPDTGLTYVIWQQTSCDNLEQTIDVRTIIDETNADGALLRRLYRDFRLRYVHRWEMHQMLTANGFEVVELFGDFHRSPFEETSEEMVWVASPLRD